MKLLINASVKFAFGLLLVGALLFVPAGSFGFMGAWRFLALLFIPMLILGTVLFIKAPSLLQKRLDSKEKENTQKGVVAASALMFVLGFVAAGLDFRFGISQVPDWVVALACAVLLISYAFYGEVMRENAYLSRTIGVQEGQRVIDRGLYGIVRHPMYAVTVWLFLSVPVVLGSWIALCFFLPYIVLIIIRICNEEKVLLDSLSGYDEYTKKVRYRLIPFVW